jgi:hypothetical protein
MKTPMTFGGDYGFKDSVERVFLVSKMVLRV